MTIPTELLNSLNNHDFYTDILEENLASQVNKYFGTVICACIPNVIKKVVSKFKGRILFRAFGLEGRKTYADVIENECGLETIELIKKNSKRMWLAQSYGNIALNEPQWFRDMAINLPIGLPAYIYDYNETWQGTIAKIMFVCPRINTISYYWKTYCSFKEVFGDMPHSIAGAQPVAVKDDNVLGFVEGGRYREMLQTYKVMYYHSIDERHLHYHPLEAIVVGMPVVFMAGGLLDYLSGWRLSGRCSSTKEARGKITRILDGDIDFINEIKRLIVK